MEFLNGILVDVSGHKLETRVLSGFVPSFFRSTKYFMNRLKFFVSRLKPEKSMVFFKICQ